MQDSQPTCPVKRSYITARHSGLEFSHGLDAISRIVTRAAVQKRLNLRKAAKSLRFKHLRALRALPNLSHSICRVRTFTRTA